MARPRSVSEEDTLERALRLFWKQGYERTSIADLSAAIGVGPSSIYNSFGSKKGLFQRVMTHYMKTHAAFTKEVLDGKYTLPAGEAMTCLLRGGVALYTRRGGPPGCAMLQSGGAGAPGESEACAITWEFKLALERALETLFEARQKRGDLLTATPAILAKFIVGTMRGLSQLACDGTSRVELERVAMLAARSCVS